jgi:carboxyl-terminal processing protease
MMQSAKRMSKQLLYPFIAAGLVMIGMLVGFTIKSSIAGNSALSFSSNLNKFQDVIRLVSANYFEEVKSDKMIDDAIVGMLKGLDPHTFYIPADEFKQVNEQMTGKFQGIGIEFNILEDTIYVVSPITGGPSEKLGIQPGDRIVKIDDQNVAGVNISNNDVFKKLRGPKGTKVKVSIKRQSLKSLLDFEIIRDDIPINSVDYSYMVDNKTGYIKVGRFAETTIDEFVEHLTKLKSKGMENLVLDLRNNPGGYLDKARIMADMFLSHDKLIVYTKGRIPSSNHEYRTTPNIQDFEKGGLVILINQGSASASEIVSGAVQDWDRGIIVGTRSFGKGLVQQQYALNDGSAIRVVISRYFTPAGRCIQKPYTKGSKDYEDEVSDRYESGELFDPSKVKFPDSLKFKTQSGRTVYGGGGIMPDVFVPADTSGTSTYLTSLFIKNVFRTFAFRYAESHPQIKTQYKDGFEYAKKFEVTDAMLKDFTTHATEKGATFVEKDYNKSLKYIRLNIKSMIGRALFNDDGFYPVTLSMDETFKKALSLIPDAVKLEKTGKFNKE